MAMMSAIVVVIILMIIIEPSLALRTRVPARTSGRHCNQLRTTSTVVPAISNPDNSFDDRNNVPVSGIEYSKKRLHKAAAMASSMAAVLGLSSFVGNAIAAEDSAEASVGAAESAMASTAAAAAAASDSVAPRVPAADIKWGEFKLPYEHQNLKFGPFIGAKATILFNMKIDDPQTVNQFPSLLEIYNKYKKQGLNVHAFPTEQGE
jgi:hypothetical protein